MEGSSGGNKKRLVLVYHLTIRLQETAASAELKRYKARHQCKVINSVSSDLVLTSKL